MPEILTESFCERCGTRYTFESAAPRKARRLGQFKTLSKGMKNWVMSDDTSLDEAMAAARNDDERELTSQQLDAFHATFNFCMTCRQYTCGNCWNTTEGRCLTCAPHLGHEILPAPFPEHVAPIRLEAEAWPDEDVAAASAASNGNGLGNGFHPEVVDPWAGTSAVELDGIAEFDPAARLAFLSGETPTPTFQPETDAIAEAPAWPSAPAWPGADAPAWPGADIAPAAAELPVEPIVAAPAQPASAEPALAAAETPAEPDPAVDALARTGAARTTELLRRFRPGQNIDAELAAFEAEQERAARVASGEPVEMVEPPMVEAPIEVFAEPSPTPVAPTPEPEPAYAAAAEHVVEPAPEPAAPPIPPAAPIPPVAPRPTPVWPIAAEPIAAELPREDRIPQPTWQVFAPDLPVPGAQPPSAPVPSAPPQPFGLRNDPQWPVQPDQAESPAMALLANRANRTSNDAVWAASAQEVLARPTSPSAGIQPAGVQPCSSCGLSLSATARFCRRCGTRQG